MEGIPIFYGPTVSGLNLLVFTGKVGGPGGVGTGPNARPPSLVKVVSDVSHDVGALATEALGGGR